MRHDEKVLLLCLGASLPGLLVALGLLWFGDFSAKVQWTSTAALIVLLLGFSFALRERVLRPLQVLANLLAAIREGDYSLRARKPAARDALGLVLREINTLGEILKGQRFTAVEASLLLEKALAEIPAAIFVFDAEHKLRLLNRAGCVLLSSSPERALGRTAADLELETFLAGSDSSRIVEAEFPRTAGRFDVRRSSTRAEGRPQHLLVLTSVEHALREEERQAFDRLVRVMSHEINNSLAPIQSVAATLLAQLERPLSDDWQDDFLQGLQVIHRRAAGLNRFVTSYARLARLPEPTPTGFAVRPWLERVIHLETRMRVQLEPGPEIELHADQDQLDQVLINLVRNAVDAALETAGGVRVGWRNGAGQLEIWVEDEGPGLAETTNLFVPFFTTKKNGSGIGLALSRKIVERHGGRLALANRADARGCRASVTLPVPTGS